MKQHYTPEAVLNEIRTHIIEVISQYVALKPAGRSLKTRCPFHREQTPSFFVHGSRHMFKCFGCGVSGDVFAFLQRMERVPFPEAIRRAAAILGIRVGGAPAGSSVAFAKAQRQRRIQRGATIWREEEIRKHIEELRHRDELVVFAHQIYDYCDQHGVDKVLREEAVSDLLHVAYIGDKPYSLLEYEFGRLLCSDVSTAQLHREIG